MGEIAPELFQDLIMTKKEKKENSCFSNTGELNSGQRDPQLETVKIVRLQKRLHTLSLCHADSVERGDILTAYYEIQSPTPFKFML